MRRLLFLSILLATIITMSSCEDENTSRAKEIANQFADAVNSKDKATIYELYPNVNDMPNISIISNIDKGKVRVEYNDKNKEYQAFFGNNQRPSISLKIDSTNTMNIMDSYGIIILDSVVYELALKTGVPINKLSDKFLCDLMRERGSYINWIGSKYTWDDLITVESCVFVDDSYPPILCATIRNKGDKNIKGEDYKIVFDLYYKIVKEKYLTLIEEGIDVNSKGRENLNVLCYGNNGDFGDINNNTDVVYHIINNGLSLHERLLKYADITGEEYLAFLNEDKKMKENENILDEIIEIVSNRKLSKDDLRDLLPPSIRILRNSIYAKHGYIFKDTTLKDYFNKRTWYSEKTNDMNKISKEFNEIERYNINFIKQYENN